MFIGCYAAALDGPGFEAVLNLEPDGLDCDQHGSSYMFICRVIVYSFISFFSKGNISFRILIINERDFNLSWFSYRSTEVSHLITPHI